MPICLVVVARLGLVVDSGMANLIRFTWSSILYGSSSLFPTPKVANCHRRVPFTFPETARTLLGFSESLTETVDISDVEGLSRRFSIESSEASNPLESLCD